MLLSSEDCWMNWTRITGQKRTLAVWNWFKILIKIYVQTLTLYEFDFVEFFSWPRRGQVPIPTTRDPFSGKVWPHGVEIFLIIWGIKAAILTRVVSLFTYFVWLYKSESGDDCKINEERCRYVPAVDTNRNHFLRVQRSLLALNFFIT